MTSAPIAVFGLTNQLTRVLNRKCVTEDRATVFFNKQQYDVTKPESIIGRAFTNISKLNAVIIAAVNTAVVLPAYSVLDLDAYQSTFNKVLPDWRESLRHALKDRKTGSIHT